MVKKEKIENLVNNLWNDFPQDKKREIISSLLKNYANSKKSTIFHLPTIRKNSKLPFLLTLSIVSSDWPGLSDSCIGVLHERGWNISYIEAFVADWNEKKLGIILLGLEIKSKKELNEFLKDKNHILRNLQIVATGSGAKSSLLAGETKKLEIYGNVMEQIKKMVRNKKERQGILKDEGEAFKFFSSRSESYLEERKYQDLAQQIVKNYRLQNLVRKTGGRPQFWIKNIKTKREHLTGITIAAFERDISLNDWLAAIYQAVPGYNIKYNKEFVTEDGIVVYRIEMCDKHDKPYSKRKIYAIKKALDKAQITRRMERFRWMEQMGGFEHYMRAIIPFLVKEFSSSYKPQVYINVINMTSELAKFKILLVTESPSQKKPSYGYTITERLEKVRGIDIISVKPPKKYGKAEVSIIDIGAKLDMFSTIEKVYRIIRKTIRNVIGEFRDFDKGMRVMEVTKLMKVKKMLKEYAENFVREFYYRLDDFYRIGAEPEEIAEQIKLGIKGLEIYENKKQRYILIKKDIASKSGDSKEANATILVIVCSSKINLLSRILKLLRDFTITLSKIERRDVNVIIIKGQKNDQTIPDSNIDKIRNFLETIPPPG